MKQSAFNNTLPQPRNIFILLKTKKNMACANPMNSRGLARLSQVQTNQVNILEQEAEQYIDDGKSNLEVDKSISPPIYYLSKVIDYATWTFSQVSKYLAKKAEKPAEKLLKTLERNVACIDDEDN